MLLSSFVTLNFSPDSYKRESMTYFMLSPKTSVLELAAFGFLARTNIGHVRISPSIDDGSEHPHIPFPKSSTI